MAVHCAIVCDLFNVFSSAGVNVGTGVPVDAVVVTVTNTVCIDCAAIVVGLDDVIVISDAIVNDLTTDQVT
jgi:hypothetical protein